MVDVADKLVYFQAITGLDDPDLCTEILSAHGWDLERAISAFTSPGPDHSDFPSFSGGSAPGDVGVSAQSHSRTIVTAPHSVPVRSAIAWKLITLPVSVISGSLRLISSTVGFGLWAAGGAISYTLGVVGLGGGRTGDESSSLLVPVSTAGSEAINFVSGFRSEFGDTMPNFVREGFMDALQRSQRDFKLLFVYLHSRDHPDTPSFCERTLCSDVVVAFVNENFVSWGGSIRGCEGFKMSNSLKASRFPFCAMVMGATNQRIALLQQVEGPRSPQEMLAILQKVFEECSPTLVTARVEFEERRNNIRLREEQDAAFQAALEADQARERQRREDNERLKMEAAEAEKKCKEEEEAHQKEELEAAEKIAALARTRHQKFLSLGTEPEKGPDVTQVVVRFPNGLRKERRFVSSMSIEKLYDFVDSLDCLEMGSYSLVSNFPRMVYGSQMFAMSLKEAGLHPQASLFVEPN